MFRRRFAGSSALDADDAAEIERVLERASRAVDDHCHRNFYALTATRVFDGNGDSRMWIPDLLAVTSVKFDEDGNRVFELSLAAATDYFLKRPGHDDEDALPRTMIILDDVNGQRSSFTCRERLVEIVGRWGYTEAVERIVPTITLADGATETATLSAAGDVQNGQTLRVSASSEQVYVRSGGGTTTLTVTRGVNGTTAAGAAGAAVDRFVYVDAVVEATLIMASRRWKRREQQFASVTSSPSGFEVARAMAVDPDVQMDLSHLVRGDGMV
jgi:hypothetical protein